ELENLIDRERYAAVLGRLDYQAGHAIVWRDAVTGWFARTSGIPDAKARIGRAEGRIEAESMTLDGFTAGAVTPWETASGGQAARVPRGAHLRRGSRTLRSHRAVFRRERRRVTLRAGGRRAGDRSLGGGCRPAVGRAERSHVDAADRAGRRARAGRCRPHRGAARSRRSGGRRLHRDRLVESPPAPPFHHPADRPRPDGTFPP